MKAILMSIKPQHATNILNGKKTIEIRKTFPEDYVGWVYIYCTKGKGLYETTNATTKIKTYSTTPEPPIYGNGYKLEHLSSSGKVVARFWCDRIDKYDYYQVDEELSTLACVPLDQLEIYVGSGIIGAIRITKLEIFDKPKEISEFYKLGAWKVYEEQIDSSYMKRTEQEIMKSLGQTLTRAPQSYWYIEV